MHGVWSKVKVDLEQRNNEEGLDAEAEVEMETLMIRSRSSLGSL